MSLTVPFEQTSEVPSDRRNVLGLALGSAVLPVIGSNVLGLALGSAVSSVIGSIGQQDNIFTLPTPTIDAVRKQSQDAVDPLDEMQDQQLVINRFLSEIEDKQQSRGRLDTQIIDGLDEAAKMKEDIDIRMDRLMTIEANIADTTTERNDLERTLSDAEAELSRVLTSSSTLLEKMERKSGY
jgi:hypothetical protein